MSAPTLAERASRRYAGLGTRLIWIGGILLLAMAMTIDLATTIDLLGRIADPVPILTAWIVLVIADAAILIVTHILGAHLPNWMFWLWVAALAIVLGLDLAATRHVENPGAALSVGVSAAFSLMLAVVTRPSFQIIPPSRARSGSSPPRTRRRTPPTRSSRSAGCCCRWWSPPWCATSSAG